jgi:MoaA/NifB/PqqE/SkfB family radical SAM enzyme
MNIYKLLRLNRVIRNHRIKFLALYLLHKLKRRYLAVNFDPVLACNLRCKMCYFTDADYVKTLKGQFKEDDIELIEKELINIQL